MMRRISVLRLIVAPSVFLSMLQAGLAQPNTILDFYPHADSVCRFPSIDRPLSVICRKKISARYVTFVGFGGDPRVLLAAVTLKPITDAEKSISLTVDFNGIQPNPGKVSTWGYVYDRNADGKIDYLALVGGAAAYKAADFPEDFPLRGQQLSIEQIDYFVGHCKTVFNHWADDNFDDTLDAVVHIDMDPQREWVDRQIVVRSTAFDGAYDDVWCFRDKMGDVRDSAEHTPTSVPFHPIGRPPDTISGAAFADKTGILQLLNKAARECGLGPANFYHDP